MSKNWLIPAGLVGLSLIPVVAGSLRLAEFAGGAAVLPDGDRIGTQALPIVVHIVSVTVFSLLGAFQFAPGFRRRNRGWHRIAGRTLVPSGVVAALSGLWLTFALPPGAFDSQILTGVRVAVATFMTGSLLMGFVAVRRRDFPAHRAWMIRGYAIGVAAGTQAFTSAAWLVAIGPVTTTGRTVTMTGAWLLNAAVAEWVIRRGRPGGAVRRRARPSPPAVPVPRAVPHS
ncbi:DUF2306 domain-containing protein [Paractinoplanes rishiriensis]|uniref:Membrane protein n=1 Tax=Paractinoplanes rishiriensis TaxID=1050105 RepID=A0A919JUW9_9ACTN|nr:DUF2306 domain-containing protein [Actinoplanes rishiriensis]GIE95265.1 membrane protein [Actinoplanes rishiriensis]